MLVIADEGFDRRTLTKLLKGEGLDVVTAACGEQAIETLRGRQFEVAIADLVVPEINGSQTTSAWREIIPAVEVIMLTGHVTIDASMAALRQGACDLLAKPVDAAELRSALNRALGRRRSRLSRADASARAVIETAAEAIVGFDKKGVVREFNPVAGQVIETGRSLAAKVEKVRQPDGQFYRRLTSKVPIRDTQGRIIGLVGISRDVTECMQAEETLRASEERDRELFENASDIVYTTGFDTCLASLNRAGIGDCAIRGGRRAQRTPDV